MYILRAQHGQIGIYSRSWESPEGNEEAVIVSTLPVLRASCYLRAEVLLLCGVTVAHEKAKRDEHLDDMLAPLAG